MRVLRDSGLAINESAAAHILRAQGASAYLANNATAPE